MGFEDSSLCYIKPITKPPYCMSWIKSTDWHYISCTVPYFPGSLFPSNYTRVSFHARVLRVPSRRETLKGKCKSVVIPGGRWMDVSQCDSRARSEVNVASEAICSCEPWAVYNTWTLCCDASFSPYAMSPQSMVSITLSSFNNTGRSVWNQVLSAYTLDAHIFNSIANSSDLIFNASPPLFHTTPTTTKAFIVSRDDFLLPVVKRMCLGS